ncbi:hypothetical protein TNCV_3817161 [Trichonephila clavipes]|nr:hypothetical protein TNCV_3817161 [Trichonephila clavipes]
MYTFCALEFDGDRNDETAVSRLLSKHLKCMTFESGRKVFQTCPKRHLLPASPEYILDCLAFALKDVHASPLLVLDFAMVLFVLTIPRGDWHIVLNRGEQTFPGCGLLKIFSSCRGPPNVSGVCEEEGMGPMFWTLPNSP